MQQRKVQVGERETVYPTLSLKGSVYRTRRWWEGEACRIWVRQAGRLSEDEALSRLKATLGADFLQTK
jgi:hypothetical protein